MENHFEKFTLRKFQLADIEAIAELERRCNPMPWSSDSLHRFASDADSATAGFISIGIVAAFESTQQIIGYVCATVVADEAEILVLGVDPEFRKQGTGSALLMELKNALKNTACKNLFLEVRLGNKAAVSLYHKAGFVDAGIRKGYYEDTGEDALLLRWDLSR